MTRGTVEREINGRKYSASYRVEKDMLIVSTGLDSKKAVLRPGVPPESLAAILLHELAADAKARGE
jgi:hypothetical protein